MFEGIAGQGGRLRTRFELSAGKSKQTNSFSSHKGFGRKYMKRRKSSKWWKMSMAWRGLERSYMAHLLKVVAG